MEIIKHVLIKRLCIEEENEEEEVKITLTIKYYIAANMLCYISNIYIY